MKQLIRTNRLILLLIMAVSFLGCDNDDDANLKPVIAGFTFTQNEETDSVAFINISEEAEFYAWDFGDGTTSTLANPVKTFEPGTYTVILVATNSAGLTETFEDTITIVGEDPVTPDPTDGLLSLPITFDDSAVDYTGSIEGAFSVVDNPAPGGANNVASKVGAIENAGAEWETIVVSLATPVDFSTDKTITMKLWSESVLPILLKFEGGVNGERENEVVVNHGGTGWEELSFDFATNAIKSYIDGNQGAGEAFVPEGQYATMAIFVDGPGTTAGTFYIDDIEQVAGGDSQSAVLELPITFDDSAVDYAGSIEGAFSVVDNPALGGANNVASKVGAIENAGAEWEATVVSLATPVDFSIDKTITMKLWSESVLPILLKFEGGVNGERENEVVVNHGGTGWEELSFDFATNAIKSYIDGNQGAGEAFVPEGQYATMVIFVDGPGTTAGTFYIDDIMQISGIVVEGGPTSAAPTPPARNAADVISLFSNAYTDITVSEWSTGWDDADIADVVVEGDDIKKVTLGDEGGFLGVDFSANSFDATAFTHFHMDYWVSDAITAGQVFNPKWSNHAGGAEVNAFEYTNPATQSGQWVSVDVPISDFLTDTTRDNLAQFILATSNTLDEVYFDNVYLYKSDVPVEGPTSAAPTPPARNAADVISLFSNAYTDITVSEWSTGWDDADIADVVVEGDDIKKVTLGDEGGFLGVDFSANSFDATAFTHFHMDYWVSDAITAGQVFNPKWSNHAGGAEVNAFEYTNPTTQSGQWVSVDVPISDFLTDTTRDNLAQFILATSNTLDEVYFDNVYLYKTDGQTSGCTGSPVAAAALPVDFEGCDSFVSTFSAEGSITTSLSANPSQANNTSANALQIVKASGTNRWAGIQNKFDSSLDLTKTFKLKVYSSKANVVFKFEVNNDPQDPNSGNPLPVYVTITDANTWTDVEFMITGIPPSNTGVNQFVIKPDNPEGSDGELTSTEETYYIDDLRLE